MKAIVILNAQHKLLPSQETLLQERFCDGFEIYPVPVEGWTLDEMKGIKDELLSLLCQNYSVVFVSPIPALLLMLSQEYYELWGRSDGLSCGGQVYVLHNDKREKKEVNGRIISVVAQDGWQLV